MWRLLALVAALALVASQASGAPSAGARAAKRIGAPYYDLNFRSGSLPIAATVTRASTATDLLYTSASGASFNSYSNNVPRINPTNGLLIEEARTNQLLNSGTPATQTTASLATGFYCLWVNGSGSAAVTAGTATITGAGTASQGVPVVFDVTVAGTVTVTVTGSLNQFQLEKGPGPSSYIPTTASTATRQADQVAVKTSAFTPYGGTFAATFIILSGGNLSTDNHLLFGNGPTPFAPFHSNNITTPMTVVSDSGTPTVTHPSTMAFNTLHRGASTWGPRGLSVTFDGKAPAFANNYTASAAYGTWANFQNILLFDENANNEVGSGWLQRWRIWNYQVSPELLQELSVSR